MSGFLYATADGRFVESPAIREGAEGQSIQKRPRQWILEKPGLLARSEERRVGKEGRYQCDWSSDVCSSDLDGRFVESPAIREGAEGQSIQKRPRQWILEKPGLLA